MSDLDYIELWRKEDVLATMVMSILNSLGGRGTTKNNDNKTQSRNNEHADFC